MSARVTIGAALAALALLGFNAAWAAECSGNPNALGTHRVLEVDPRAMPRVGLWSYPTTLPLEDHEVVLTFDDGPMARKTPRVLDALARECVKATFFVVGQMVRSSPALLRRVLAEGHTVGTHTDSHPHLARLSTQRGRYDIEKAVETVKAVLGEGDAAPFFRAPYLEMPAALETELTRGGRMIWSIDLHASDWSPISSQQVIENALTRLEHAGRGILLLHDIQERTVRALPKLLRELQRRGFHVVHVVPTTAAE